MRLTIFLVFLISTTASAGEKAITADAENYTAVGYSENSSEQLAKQDACNAARRELIGYIFGAAYQINQNMVKSLGVLDYSQDVAVNSGEVIIRGAITDTSFGGSTTKCTITYPIQEAKLEKERLKSANSKTVKFTDIGDANSLKGGVLEIVTVPDEVEVLIDNVRWGVTPLRLYGKLSAGTHLLRLEDPNYKIIEEQIEVGTTSKTRIDKVMKRATGRLTIRTDPSGAKVRINSQEVGRSPIGSIELLAGQNLRVEIEHSEAEANSQSLRLIRDEEKALIIKLPLRPAFVSLNTNPADATIVLDGSKAELNRWIQVEPGAHKVKVSKSGYISTNISIDLVGGERKAMPTIILESLSERERLLQEEEMQRQKEAEQSLKEKLKQERDEKDRKAQENAEINRHLMFSPWITGVSLGWAGPTFKDDPASNYVRFCLDGGKRFLGFISLDLSYCADGSSQNSSETNMNKYDMSGSSAHASATVFFTESFYLKPSVGYLSHSYKITQYSFSNGNTSASYQVSQAFEGAAVGYELRWSQIFLPIELGINRYEDSGAFRGSSSGILTFGILYAF